MTTRRRINFARPIYGMLVAVLIVGCSSENDRWSKARQADTADAYAAYLAKYPAGTHRNEALERHEARRWQEVQAADSLEALNLYLQEYPNGRFAAAARSAVTDFPKSVLQRAVRKNDLDAMRALLDKSTPVDSIEGAGMSALHIAADACNEPAVALLLAHRADVNVRASDDTTPLHNAVYSGCMPAVRTLIDAGADPNLQVRPAMQAYVRMGDGTFTYLRGGQKASLGTALHWAAAGQRLEIAKLLIERRADVNAMTPREIAPLHYAAESGSTAMIELLLSKGATTHYKPNPATDFMRLPNEVAMVPNGQAIHYAKTGAIAALLMTHGARIGEPSKYRGQPLHSTTALGYDDAVRYFLDNKVPVDVLAPWNIDSGRTIDATPLWIAAANSRLGLIKLLEQRGGNLNFVASDSTGNFGGSLLHAAAWQADAEVVNYLLTKGLPVDARADMPTAFPLAAPFKNVTPLGIAAHYGNVPAMAALVEAGADVDAVSDDKWTPIKLAVIGQQVDAVRFLLDQGASIPYAADIIDRLNSSDAVKKLLKERLVRSTSSTKTGA